MTSPDPRLVGSDRVLAVLIELAKYPHGIGLDEIARAIASPKPTVHRALASLKRAGLAAQDGRGHYVLGDEFIRMAFAHHEARPDQVRIQPILERLAERFGETVHYTILDGHSVVYRSKVDPVAGAVKLTSTVGGRNPAHCTAAGKLLLSFRLADEQAVRDWVGADKLEVRTANSVSTVRQLAAQLKRARTLGYSVDDQENESGINCLAVPAFMNSPSAPSGAISISAMAYRTPLRKLVNSFPEIQAIVAGAN